MDDGSKKPESPPPDLPPIGRTPLDAPPPGKAGQDFPPPPGPPLPPTFQGSPPPSPPKTPRTWIVVLCCVIAGLIGVGAIGGAVVLFSGDDSSPTSATGSDRVDERAGDPADGAVPDFDPGDGSDADAEAEEYVDPPVEDRLSFAWFEQPRAGWTARVPDGSGWGAVRVQRSSRELIVTEQIGDDATVQIWTTPHETPRMSLEPEEKAGSRTLDGGVEEIVFASGIGGDLIPDCAWDRCVDYLVDMGGGGFAVLVSAPTVADAKRIGRPIASSIGYSD